MHPPNPSESTAIAAMLRKYLFMFQNPASADVRRVDRISSHSGAK
jgi:hypothetical protein